MKMPRKGTERRKDERETEGGEEREEGEEEEWKPRVIKEGREIEKKRKKWGREGKKETMH